MSKKNFINEVRTNLILLPGKSINIIIKYLNFSILDIRASKHYIFNPNDRNYIGACNNINERTGDEYTD